jgi:prepilin-type N-terminal cleavage/methylation domain-containing protein
MRARRRSDGGFTLVEIMVSIAIVGILVVPLARGMFVGARAMSATSNRFTSSSAAQLLSLYFPTDVQGADAASTTSSCSGVSNAKVQLTADDPTTGVGVVLYVVYWVRNTSSNEYDLIRSQWNTATCSSAAAKTTVVARNLIDALAANVAATVTTTSGLLQGVTLKMTEKTTSADPTPYVFYVTADRRATA